MLFGNQHTQKIILEKAFEIAEKEKIQIVFGAMVGSISQGVHSVDSDYDTRFLYINSDFPKKIYYPNEYKEDELVKRYYPEEETFYDKIPFWELTSFLQFLREPSIDKKYSVGLYNLIGWTFKSPYIWDPYGLSNKIVPYLKSVFNQDPELKYHISKIDEFFSSDSDEILVKNYLYSIISAASIQYILKYDDFPPVHILTLMNLEDNVIVREKVYDFIIYIRNESKRICEVNKKVELQYTHYKMKVKHDKQIDQYIEYWCQKGVEELGDKSRRMLEVSDNKIINIYDLISLSINEGIIENICK